MANAVAKTETASTAVEVVSSRQTGETLLSTFSTETREDKVTLYNALANPKSLRKEKMIDKAFNLANVIIREEQYTDAESGEVRDSESVIMVTDEGDAFYLSSATLGDSVRNILSAFGDPADQEERSLKVKVISDLTQRGYTFYQMVPVI